MSNDILTDMIIEIPYNSNIKYEMENNILRCDRILNTSMMYPGNYGYIPNTLSGDGDPLDALLLAKYSLLPGSIIKVKLIGVLFTTDESEEMKNYYAYLVKKSIWILKMLIP